MKDFSFENYIELLLVDWIEFQNFILLYNVLLVSGGILFCVSKLKLGCFLHFRPDSVSLTVRGFTDNLTMNSLEFVMPD